MTPRLKEQYTKEIAPTLNKRDDIQNRMQIPRVTKVVVNQGYDAQMDKDTIKALSNDLATITGQRPAMAKARVSISNFKLREGMVVGAKVTLRGDRMWEFLDRLINSALPRIRDFRGVNKKAFDGRCNYSLGLKEQTIFPEINPDNIKKVHGMDVTIVTSSANDDQARELLVGLGMPFAK